MRRTDREITDINEIYSILERNNVVRIAMNGGDYPYAIPMTFGCSLEDGEIVIYFHSASEGKKWEMLDKDPRVCIEADLYYRTEEVSGGVTARYESVIGFGKVERMTDPKDKLLGMKYILDHYNRSGFPVTSCKGMSKCEVYYVKLESVTGKRNV